VKVPLYLARHCLIQTTGFSKDFSIADFEAYEVDGCFTYPLTLSSTWDQKFAHQEWYGGGCGKMEKT
jgi:hypothetical protein